jgi:hypothetical protein
MASNATPKPETSTTTPSTLSKSSTAAPVLVTAPAPSSPGPAPAAAVLDDHQATSITPVIAQVDKSKAVKLRFSDEEPRAEPAAEIGDRLSESTGSEPPPTVVVIEENSSPTVPPREEDYTQEQSTTLPSTRDNNAKTTHLHNIIPSSVGKPYQNGIQVPCHVRLAVGYASGPPSLVVLCLWP